MTKFSDTYIRHHLAEALNLLASQMPLYPAEEPSADAGTFYTEKMRLYARQKDTLRLTAAAIHLAAVYHDEAWQTKKNSAFIKTDGLIQFAKNCLNKMDFPKMEAIVTHLDHAAASCILWTSTWGQSVSANEIPAWHDRAVTGDILTKCCEDDAKNRKKLADLRQKFEENIADLPPHSCARFSYLFNIYQNCFYDLRDLLTDMFFQSLSFFDTEPPAYVWVISGSHSRLSGTPWSDIESFFIIDDPDAQDYFLEVMKILMCKIYHLGETILPAMGLRGLRVGDIFDDLSPNGLAFDWDNTSCQNTPFGVRVNGIPVYRLTDSIQGLIQLSKKFLGGDSTLPQILRSTRIICGDSHLYWRFKSDLNRQNVRPYFLRKFMKEAENSIRNISALEKNRATEIKNAYYRPVTITIENLYSFFGRQDEASPYQKILWLSDRGIISESQKNIMRDCLSQVLYMRAQQALTFREQKTAINADTPGFTDLMTSLSAFKTVLQTLYGKMADWDRKMLMDEHRFFGRIIKHQPDLPLVFRNGPSCRVP